MITAIVDGKSQTLTYKCDSDMRTKATYKGRATSLGLSCDVYIAEDDEHIVLVLTTAMGDIRNSVTVITNEAYAEIAALYDPYHGGAYHTALLEECGAENHLKIK